VTSVIAVALSARNYCRNIPDHAALAILAIVARSFLFTFTRFY